MADARSIGFLIWGAGGHGKVVADLVRATGCRVEGYIDADDAKLGSVVEPGGGRVILLQGPAQTSLPDSLPQGVGAIALAIGNNSVRLSCLEIASTTRVPSLVHPAATVSPSAAVGRGAVVFAGAIINSGAAIGEAVILNSGAIVEHDCQLSDGVHVSPGAVLAGGVRVGKRSWIGAGATVIPGVTIGADVIVGAGAVVLHDVPDGQTVAGVPARRIDDRGQL